MKQNLYCTEVGVLPGTDFRMTPNYMNMLNLSELGGWPRGRGNRSPSSTLGSRRTPDCRIWLVVGTT